MINLTISVPAITVGMLADSRGGMSRCVGILEPPPNRSRKPSRLSPPVTRSKRTQFCSILPFLNPAGEVVGPEFVSVQAQPTILSSRERHSIQANRSLDGQTRLIPRCPMPGRWMEWQCRRWNCPSCRGPRPPKWSAEVLFCGAGGKQRHVGRKNFSDLLEDTTMKGLEATPATFHNA